MMIVIYHTMPDREILAPSLNYYEKKSEKKKKRTIKTLVLTMLFVINYTI